MTAITASTTLEVILTDGAFTNPVVVEAGVTLSGGVFTDVSSTTFFTVQNEGIISSPGPGVNLDPGGSVINVATASIAGNYEGVGIDGSGGTVVNYGTIAPTGHNNGYIEVTGVRLGSGGTVTNAASGLISADGFGVGIFSAAGTVVNNGSMMGGNAGVYLKAGGSVTNGASASIYAHGFGIEAFYGVTTVVNDGSVVGAGNYGIQLNAGGSVTNAASASITGRQGAIEVGGAGTVINYGSVAGTGFNAVYLFVGGSVTNATSASITGYTFGVHVGNGPGTVVNYGSIVATSAPGVQGGDSGVFLGAGGLVTNAASASIIGGYGVDLYRGGTLTNAGTIGGNSGGMAVYFGGTVSSLLVVDPGAVFSGIVESGTSSSGTLELASGASEGTLAGLGSQYVNFAQVTIDSDAIWVLGGSETVAHGVTLTELDGANVTASGKLVNNGVILLDPSTLTAGTLIGNGSLTIGAGSTFDAQDTVAVGEKIAFGGANALLQLDSPSKFAGTINGFASGRTIELTKIAHNPTDSATIIGSNTLQVVTSGGTFDLQLNKSQNFAGDTFPLTPNGGGTDINVACFAEGTRIATERGMVAVEALHEDDRVRTMLDGKLRPIVWLGYRRVDCRHHLDPTQVWPIRMSTGAFGPGRPYRDLLLSPDHAIFVGDVLIPIRYLVNGRTISQQSHSAITYWHVELLDHDVLCAEGVPAESYLDTGNRGAFANGGGAVDLHPDFARRVWERHACAELVMDGPRLAASKRRLLARASALGHRSTDDSGLSVLADGGEIPVERHGRVWRMRLPEPTTNVRLVSRVWNPAHMQPDSDDTRSLGVAITRLWLDRRAVDLDEPCFTCGWHAPEPKWRWTDGDASLTPTGARELAFEVALTGSYWQGEEREEVRAA